MSLSNVFPALLIAASLAVICFSFLLAAKLTRSMDQHASEGPFENLAISAVTVSLSLQYLTAVHH